MVIGRISVRWWEEPWCLCHFKIFLELPLAPSRKCSHFQTGIVVQNHGIWNDPWVGSKLPVTCTVWIIGGTSSLWSFGVSLLCMFCRVSQPTVPEAWTKTVSLQPNRSKGIATSSSLPLILEEGFIEPKSDWYTSIAVQQAQPYQQTIVWHHGRQKACPTRKSSKFALIFKGCHLVHVDFLLGEYVSPTWNQTKSAGSVEVLQRNYSEWRHWFHDTM